MTETSPLIKQNIDLAPFNTLNVHLRAPYFAKASTLQELTEILEEYKPNNKPIFILGGGSNMLFTNRFKGLIIHISIGGKELLKEDEKHIWLKIGAGENWHQTVRYCVEKGWGGIENLSLIPGTVGAAPIQNIGAYGVELSDVFEQLTAVEIATGEKRVFNPEECQFGYRSSVFKKELKNQFVVTDVTLKLSKHPQVNTSYGAIQDKLDQRRIKAPTIRDISDIVMEIRKSKLPHPEEMPNAGSFFKNPIIKNEEFERLQKRYSAMPGYPVGDGETKVPAGWLIEQTGWKGKKVGSVGTYRQQALVIVNHGGATGQEILEVSRRIQEAVKTKFEIELVPEVNIVG